MLQAIKTSVRGFVNGLHVREMTRGPRSHISCVQCPCLQQRMMNERGQLPQKLLGKSRVYQGVAGRGYTVVEISVHLLLIPGLAGIEIVAFYRVPSLTCL